MFEKKYGEKARELVYRRVSRARFPSLLSRTRPLSRLSSGIPTRGIHVAAAQGTGVMRSCSSLPPPPSPPFVTGSARWKKIVFIPRIRPGRPFVYVRPLRLYIAFFDAFQNKQTNGWSSTKINCPLTIINRNSGNVPTLTEEFHRFETAGKSRSNNSSLIFG